MLGSQVFQNVDCGRDHLAFSILHWLGQPKLVEEHLAKLPGRVDVELFSSESVDLLCSGITLLLEIDCHMAESRRVNLHAG